MCIGRPGQPPRSNPGTATPAIRGREPSKAGELAHRPCLKLSARSPSAPRRCRGSGSGARSAGASAADAATAETGSTNARPGECISQADPRAKRGPRWSVAGRDQERRRDNRWRAWRDVDGQPSLCEGAGFTRCTWQSGERAKRDRHHGLDLTRPRP